MARFGQGKPPRGKFDGKSFKRLLKYLLKYKYRFLIVIICIIISAVVQVMAQMFLKTLIDDYITPLIGNSNISWTPLINFLSIMALIYLGGIVATYVYNRIMITISKGVLKDIRDELFNHLETLPISYFDQNKHGDIMSRFTNDIDTLDQVIGRTLPMALNSVISIVSIFVSMLVLNIPLTLIVILGIYVMFASAKKIAEKSGKYFVKHQDSLGNLNGYIEEMIDGVKVIKVFNHEEASKEEFVKLNNELFYNASKANGYGSMIGPVTNNVGHILYVIIALIGGLMAIKTDTFTIGAIASFLSLTHSFTRPIMTITSNFNSIIMAIAGAGRIFELMDEAPEENDGKIRLVNIVKTKSEIKETKKRTGYWAWKTDDGLIELKGDVRFNNVHFSYIPGKEVIHDVSLYAKPGQKIAFVGETGAGKTTISNLLNRFYDIDSGIITYDGIDIKEINKNDLRKSLGMVLQDTNLWTGTIMDNIRYGDISKTDEDCINAAKLANAHSFITRLPDGYNTVITGNGANLSQGQRQLLSIARCALIDPPVMILDEATSSIDTRTEKIVQDGMDKLMVGRTVLVIAHRLSTIQNAKAIMVMEHGRIIERGSHEDLLKEKGKYYDLYTGKIELD